MSLLFTTLDSDLELSPCNLAFAASSPHPPTPHPTPSPRLFSGALSRLPRARSGPRPHPTSNCRDPCGVGEGGGDNVRMAGDNVRMAADLPPRGLHPEERSAKWGKVPRFLAGVGQLFFFGGGGGTHRGGGNNNKKAPLRLTRAEFGIDVCSRRSGWVEHGVRLHSAIAPSSSARLRLWCFGVCKALPPSWETLLERGRKSRMKAAVLLRSPRDYFHLPPPLLLPPLHLLLLELLRAAGAALSSAPIGDEGHRERRLLSAA